MNRILKYVVILIVVSCSSNSKEPIDREDTKFDYKEESVNYVKKYILDPNSFELINFELDTVRLSYSIREDYLRFSDIIDTNYFPEPELSVKKDSLYNMLLLLDELNSNPTLDTAIGLQGNVRYYSINKSGQRVINTMGVVFLENSKHVTVLFDIDEEDVYDGQ
jgi:hypothetical protein